MKICSGELQRVTGEAQALSYFERRYSAQVFICLITPAGEARHSGNVATACRWACLLGQLGHQVEISHQWACKPCDTLIALHARKSFPAIERYRRDHPNRPLIVALTGTDLYSDLPTSAEASMALELASRLIALQPLAADHVPAHLRPKLRIIYQSATALQVRTSEARQEFQVCVLAHLRPVKDPLRTAYAVRDLPESSRIRVMHAGAALLPELAEAARAEEGRNPRYQWCGELSHDDAQCLLAESRTLVLTSLLEGGANVISEAIAAGVPVISSRIEGSLGLLGDDYPGYFPAQDDLALRALLLRAESDAGFYGRLTLWCDSLKPLVDPTRERESWRALLSELG